MRGLQASDTIGITLFTAGLFLLVFPISEKTPEWNYGIALGLMALGMLSIPVAKKCSEKCQPATSSAQPFLAVAVKGSLQAETPKGKKGLNGQSNVAYNS